MLFKIFVHPLDKKDKESVGGGSRVKKLSEVTEYEIDVKTGSERGAGTDANVFIVMYGEYGDSGKIALKNSRTYKNGFESNHVDSFNEKAPYVGKINKIRIGHDNKGSFPGWYLEKVGINVPLVNRKWTFRADRWLDTGKGDKQIEIDLYPTFVEETEGKLKNFDLYTLHTLNTLAMEYVFECMQHCYRQMFESYEKDQTKNQNW